MAGQEGSSSVAVSADAQFSTARILRPLTGFEDYYQGQNAFTTPAGNSVPIPFFENNKTSEPDFDGRDRNAAAGKQGYDADLMDFMPVPIGCLMKIWIPFFTDPQDVTNVQAYRYQFNWRISDIVAYRDGLAGQYHIPTQAPGAVDTLAVPPGPRFIAPAATRSVIINQPEVPTFGAQSNNVRREYLVVRAGEQPAQPLIRAASGGPVRSGVYQQGIIDPAVSAAFAKTPVFAEFEVIAGGDRLLITADRFGVEGVDTGPSTWGFALGEPDVGFSVFYGTGANTGGEFAHDPYQNVGIYVMFGSAP